MHTDELSANALGGTELMGHALYKHVDNALLDKFQIIRSRARQLDPNKPKIYWLHDMAEDPEVRHLAVAAERKKYQKLVFVSHWQQQQYANVLGVPFREGAIIPNAIEPITASNKAIHTNGDIRLIYHSTPHRGLALLVPVFEHLAQHYPITLDVYSSFKLYGWEERDKSFQDLFDRCKRHPKINYHGTVGNREIRDALSKAHIFAFPSIWAETSCLCLIEAMSARVLCVHPKFAALEETSGGLTWSYDYTEDLNEHATRFLFHLEKAIQTYLKHSSTLFNELELIKSVADRRFDWNLRRVEWDSFLRSQLNSP